MDISTDAPPAGDGSAVPRPAGAGAARSPGPLNRAVSGGRIDRHPVPRAFARILRSAIPNAKEDKPLPVYGDGKNIRDWIHVLDHCAAIDAVLHRGREGAVYNIGGRCERQNIEIVRQILAIMGKGESLITYVKDRPGHDRRYAIDCSLIEKALGWHPSMNFEQGLRQTVEWYLQNENWIAEVKSGGYQNYYRTMYEEREKTLNRL